MLRRLQSAQWVGYEEKLRRDQIASQSTWSAVPDSEKTLAAMHTIRIVPKNGTTETFVNSLDPGQSGTNTWYDQNNWNMGRVIPAGKAVRGF